MLARVCDTNDFGRFARLLIVETAAWRSVGIAPPALTRQGAT